MAGLAGVCRVCMQRVLARCISAVMAAEAIVDNIRVFERGRYPACGCVTVIAGVATTDMRRILTFGDRAVMAGVTGADNLGVIYPVCRRENGSVMAVIASIAGVQVLRVLARCNRAVVARGARA